MDTAAHVQAMLVAEAEHSKHPGLDIVPLRRPIELAAAIWRLDRVAATVSHIGFSPLFHKSWPFCGAG